jgi:hypothetical protein
MRRHVLLGAIVILLLVAAPLGPSANATFRPLITVNLATDLEDPVPTDAHCDTNTNAAGDQCTLRAAIQTANRDADPDTITFHIGTGVQTISPNSPLPVISQPLVVSGAGQPASGAQTCLQELGHPCILLEGSQAGSSANGLEIDADGSTIQDLVIGGFRRGIQVDAVAGAVVRGNYLGTNDAGTSANANFVGLELLGSSGTIIGGTSGADRNVISGSGIGIHGTSATSSLILGNYIGVDATGSTALGNNAGIQLDLGSQSNSIGGTGAGEGNVISGSGFAGVVIGLQQTSTPTSKNRVLGNLIGTDATGAFAIANHTGVVLDSPGNVVGGTAPGAGNVISGNTTFGISMVRGRVQDNRIGLPLSGDTDLGNGGGGIQASGPSVLGGQGPGQNVIAFNRGAGVLVSGNRAKILGNSIFGNDGLGIDLGDDGVTPNDPGDADGGPNHRQNFPVVDSARAGDGTIQVKGKLSSAASTNYVVRFFSSPECDPSKHGEGEQFLGQKKVTTGATGTVQFTKTLSKSVAVGQAVTATATDPKGNTSEFSACRTVAAA